MIARVWNGAVARRDGDAYAAYMAETGLPGYVRAPGNRGAWMLRRDARDRCEIVMFTLWEDLDAVKAFAGEDHEAAVFYPEDERFLVERDLRCAHYEVEAPPLGDRVRIRGERLELRSATRDDVGALAAILAEPAVARWWGHNDAASIRDELGSSFVILVEDDIQGWLQYREETAPDYRHVGFDIALATARHGKGLGAEALRLAIEHFAGRGHHRFTIDPAADNERAIRSYSAVGFRPVGTLRAYERGPDGNWRDGLLMELLVSDLADAKA